MTSQVLNLAIDKAPVYGKFMGSLVILDFIEPYQYSPVMQNSQCIPSMRYRANHSSTEASEPTKGRTQLNPFCNQFNQKAKSLQSKSRLYMFCGFQRNRTLKWMYSKKKGAQWLSGRVLDSRPRGRKTHICPSFVLVNAFC